MSEPTGPLRERAEATARVLFLNEGLAGTSLRAIARDAKCEPTALLRMYRNKTGLFRAVVERAWSGASLTSLPREGFGPAVVGLVLEKTPPFDPDAWRLIAGAMGTPEGGSVVREILQERVRAPLAEWLRGGDAAERAALITAQLTGLILLMRSAEWNLLDSEAAPRLAGRAIQTLVDG